MTLASNKLIRRFLIHVLPRGFHRIRHYGQLASSKRAENIARARELLNAPVTQSEACHPAAPNTDEPQTLAHPFPCCGGRMIISETFERGRSPRNNPADSIRIDTS